MGDSSRSYRDVGAPHGASPVEEVFGRVRAHLFHPVDETSFTVDRRLRRHGIAHLDDEDWKVRLGAVRDLTRAGMAGVPDIVSGLEDASVQVRYVSAAALGILRAERAVPELERVMRTDPDPLARSPAAVALGQIARAESPDLLRTVAATDPSRDVRHQAELSVDQIEKGTGATPELGDAFRNVEISTFRRPNEGDPAPPFILPDTDGRTHRLCDLREVGEWLVLVWVFADWCPVCHREFDELIHLRGALAEEGVAVATLECHDLYRCRVMVGKEVDPDYWFAEESFQEAYTEHIWWPHLVDRAGAVGMRYGVDPMAYAVHAEYINRPATVVIDPEGAVRFAYYGTFWGDRPSIEDVLEMIRTEHFDFEHPDRLRLP